MMKKLLLATAASGLVLSTALAQGQSPPPTDSPPAAGQKQDTAPPAAQKQDPGKPDAAKQDPGKPDGAASADQQVVPSQKPDQLLASKFSGTDVLGADDSKIGDVSDVLFDKEGKVLAYVVSIGGFLGIGSKDVALAPSAFQIVPGTNGAADKLKISMSQDELKEMATFEAYQPPRPTTTGSGTGGSRPSPTTGGAN